MQNNRSCLTGRAAVYELRQGISLGWRQLTLFLSRRNKVIKVGGGFYYPVTYMLFWCIEEGEGSGTKGFLWAKFSSRNPRESVAFQFPLTGSN